MPTIAELERDLKRAKEAEWLAKTLCTSCGGKGWFSDTTYDQCGVDTVCDRCHGTGLPKQNIDAIIANALKPFRKSKPA